MSLVRDATYDKPDCLLKRLLNRSILQTEEGSSEREREERTTRSVCATRHLLSSAEMHLFLLSTSLTTASSRLKLRTQSITHLTPPLSQSKGKRI